MMKAGDWITYNNKRKKCFGIHFNGNILIKMNGTLVQVNKEKCKITTIHNPRCGYPGYLSYLHVLVRKPTINLK